MTAPALEQGVSFFAHLMMAGMGASVCSTHNTGCYWRNFSSFEVGTSDLYGTIYLEPQSELGGEDFPFFMLMRPDTARSFAEALVRAADHLEASGWEDSQ